MKWFKKHPDFLRSESTALSNDSNYEELHQYRDNFFISHGNILARLDKVYKHPVLIVYTDATPYQLPIVYLLNTELNQGEVKHLASLSLGSLIDRIQPHIKFYYELRHQSTTGSLCILEWDNLDDGSKFYGITTILKRVRDWCAGLRTGIFPPDNQEVEYCAHFKNIDLKYYFIYPNEFTDAELIEGGFYAVRLSQESTNGGPYFGCIIDGITKSGLITQNSQYVAPFLLDDRLKSSADFQKHNGLVKEYLQWGNLFEGIWFHVSETLPPFKSLNDLIALIGNGDFDAGVKRFSATGSAMFAKTVPDNFIVGVRYPNRRGLFEFQTFRVLGKTDPPAMLIKQDPVARMREILNRYEDVAAILGEKMSPETFHLRNSVRANYNILKEKSVNIFGAGSLGSEIADGLAKAGIGNIDLFDNQSLLLNNPVRHVAGIDFIGMKKVDAMRRILLAHNPFINVRSNNINLYSNELLFNLDKHSWTISTLADDNLEGFQNEQAVIANKTIFYVRALRGGKAGRIFRVIPGKDACFQCLNLYRREESGFVQIPPDPTLPTLLNECNNPIRPGSAVDLKMIASIAARIVIDQYQNGITKENHWIWSTEKIDDTILDVPFKLYSHRLEPHPKCLYCNHDKTLTVSVSSGSLDAMKQMVLEKSGIETGGVLAGYIDSDGNAVITQASGPGPKAIHTRTRFEKDIEYCQNFLDDLFESSSGKTVYVGEWHSHPEEDNTPSGIDIKSLSDIALQKEYLTVSPVMIIFSKGGDPSCSVHPAGKRHYFADLQTGAKMTHKRGIF
jgi:integrative and conjugative element protein (TIGR02256 family)